MLTSVTWLRSCLLSFSTTVTFHSSFFDSKSAYTMGHHLADKGPCSQSYECENCTINKAERRRIDASAGEDSWESLKLKGDQTSQSWGKSTLEYSLEGLMLKLKFRYFGHLMWRPDSLEQTLMLGKIEGRRRRGWREWDGWMASPTRPTWVWVNSGSWWWTGKPGVLQSMGSQGVRHDSVTEWQHYGNKAPSFRVKCLLNLFGILLHRRLIKCFCL